MLDPSVWAGFNFGGWLLGQAPAMVVFGAWVTHLMLALRERSKRIRELETRNDALSTSLVDVVRSTSEERAERATNQMLSHESILRTTLASLESALLNKRRGSGTSSGST